MGGNSGPLERFALLLVFGILFGVCYCVDGGETKEVVSSPVTPVEERKESNSSNANLPKNSNRLSLSEVDTHLAKHQNYFGMFMNKVDKIFTDAAGSAVDKKIGTAKKDLETGEEVAAKVLATDNVKRLLENKSVKQVHVNGSTDLLEEWEEVEEEYQAEEDSSKEDGKKVIKKKSRIVRKKKIIGANGTTTVVPNSSEGVEPTTSVYDAEEEKMRKKRKKLINIGFSERPYWSERVKSTTSVYDAEEEKRKKKRKKLINIGFSESPNSGEGVESTTSVYDAEEEKMKKKRKKLIHVGFSEKPLPAVDFWVPATTETIQGLMPAVVSKQKNIKKIVTTTTESTPPVFRSGVAGQSKVKQAKGSGAAGQSKIEQAKGPRNQVGNKKDEASKSEPSVSRTYDEQPRKAAKSQNFVAPKKNDQVSKSSKSSQSTSKIVTSSTKYPNPKLGGQGKGKPEANPRKDTKQESSSSSSSSSSEEKSPKKGGNSKVTTAIAKKISPGNNEKVNKIPGKLSKSSQSTSKIVTSPTKNSSPKISGQGKGKPEANPRKDTKQESSSSSSSSSSEEKSPKKGGNSKVTTAIPKKFSPGNNEKVKRIPEKPSKIPESKQIVKKKPVNNKKSSSESSSSSEEDNMKRIEELKNYNTNSETSNTINVQGTYGGAASKNGFGNGKTEKPKNAKLEKSSSSSSSSSSSEEEDAKKKGKQKGVLSPRSLGGDPSPLKTKTTTKPSTKDKIPGSRKSQKFYKKYSRKHRKRGRRPKYGSKYKSKYQIVLGGRGTTYEKQKLYPRHKKVSEKKYKSGKDRKTGKSDEFVREEEN